jgi:hypothetical protein
LVFPGATAGSVAGEAGETRDAGAALEVDPYLNIEIELPR